MKTHAFTLLELLVVVAIIAILAAIAVPNFLEAQTRSKVSRVKNDLRVLAMAVEAYTVDHRQPPLDWNVERGDPRVLDMEEDTSGILHPGVALPGGGVTSGLTTPVAYVADVWTNDPFAGALGGIRFDQRKYTYNWFAPIPNRGVTPRPEYTFQEYEKHYGMWRLGSIGPDRDFFHGTMSLSSASIVYDPTNGTNSAGNIWRSQFEADVTSRPPLDPLIDP